MTTATTSASTATHHRQTTLEDDDDSGNVGEVELEAYHYWSNWMVQSRASVPDCVKDRKIPKCSFPSGALPIQSKAWIGLGTMFNFSYDCLYQCKLKDCRFIAEQPAAFEHHLKVNHDVCEIESELSDCPNPMQPPSSLQSNSSSDGQRLSPIKVSEKCGLTQSLYNAEQGRIGRLTALPKAYSVKLSDDLKLSLKASSNVTVQPKKEKGIKVTKRSRMLVFKDEDFVSATSTADSYKKRVHFTLPSDDNSNLSQASAIPGSGLFLNKEKKEHNCATTSAMSTMYSNSIDLMRPISKQLVHSASSDGDARQKNPHVTDHHGHTGDIGVRSFTSMNRIRRIARKVSCPSLASTIPIQTNKNAISPAQIAIDKSERPVWVNVNVRSDLQKHREDILTKKSSLMTFQSLSGCGRETAISLSSESRFNEAKESVNRPGRPLPCRTNVPIQTSDDGDNFKLKTVNQSSHLEVERSTSLTNVKSTQSYFIPMATKTELMTYRCGMDDEDNFIVREQNDVFLRPQRFLRAASKGRRCTWK